MNNFKDKCDICGKFDYLKGYKGKCLCKKCIPSDEKVQKKEKQLTIFDLGGSNDYNCSNLHYNIINYSKS